MQLYNTLSKKIENLTVSPGETVGLYACGPTVYDYTHLGHLRKYSLDDVLVRALRHEGLTVKHVQNITDVGHLSDDGDAGEDKLEKGARKYGETVWEVAKRFENYFWQSLDQMNIIKPDISCRATDHIKSQLEMVKTLEKKGYTYIIPGDGVYFDTAKFPDYGKMAGLKLEELKEGARVEAVAGKRQPADFALWKFERPGENRAMVWESPWSSRSFPGWHIECSVMSMEYLGEQFMIHTGGIDHIPVHHTNEIAQAEAATGKKPFVKFWVHHNFLQIEGEKMSKSLGNVFTIDDVVERGFEPMALRLLFLTGHYRSEMNFTWANLEGSAKAWEKLKLAVQTWRAELAQDQLLTSLSGAAEKYSETFFAQIANDLNTAQAVATLWAVVKDNQLSANEKLKLVLDFDSVLGLGLEAVMGESQATGSVEKNAARVPAEVEALLEKRRLARENRDWALSDQLRLEILALGFKVADDKDGQHLE